MDLFGTKSDTEREDEEVARLVRPAPKLKPPRHDKRREHTHPDEDPDETEDRDLSLNYKDVGASERVVRRFLAEENIVVKNKKLDDVVWVRPETLKKEPGKYEKVDPDEAPSEEGKPRPPSPARKPAKPYRHKDPIPHPEWRDRRPLPEKPVKPARPPKPVKLVPVFPVPDKEEEPPEKEPGWVPNTRTPSGRYAAMGRVLARYLDAKGPASKFIKVKNKSTGKTVRVTEQTLKDKPGAYEKVTEEEEEASFQAAREQLESLAQSSPGLKRVLDDLKKKGPAYQEAMQSPDTGIGHYDFWHDLNKEGKWPKDIETIGDLVGITDAAPKRQKDEAFFGDAHRQLREQSKEDPNLAEILRQAKPGGTWDGFSQHNPDFPLKNVFKDRKFPPGIETMGDLVQLARAKPGKKPKPEAPPKAEEKPPAKPEEKPPATKPSPDAPPPGKPGLRRPAIHDEVAPSKEKPPVEAPPAPEPKKAPGGTQESEQAKPAEKPEAPPAAPEPAKPEAPAPVPGTQVMPAVPEAPAAEAPAAEAPAAPTSTPSGTQMMPAVPTTTPSGTQMMPAVEDPAEKKDEKKDEKSKLKPEQKKELDDWIKGKGVEAEDFLAFVDKDRTTKRDKAGKPVFRQKGGPAVPFEKLPEEAQLAWKQKFDQAQKHDANVSALKTANPDVQDVLKELADPKSERSQELKALGDLTLLDPAKAIPELAGIELPDSIDSLHDVIEAAKELHKPATPPPEPKRRAVPEPERMEILRNAIRELPSGSLATMAMMHPDDIKQVVEHYTAAKGSIPSGITPSQLVAAMGGAYASDPSKIEPPKKAKDAKGREKPWDELSPKDQANAMAAHRNVVLARSMAAKAHLADKYTRAVGAPAHLADTLADFSLRQGLEPEAARQRRAIEHSERMFADSLAEEPLKSDLSPKAVKKMLDSLAKDPAAQLLATSYFQARDYQVARKQFLDKDSKDAITEFQPPREVLRRMEKAVNFLRDRSQRYPEAAQVLDPAGIFRKRVLGKLTDLNPETAKVVEQGVRAIAGKEYDANAKKWTKHQNKVTTGLSKVKTKREALEKSHADQIKAAKDEYEKELAAVAKQNVCKGPVGGPYRCPAPDSDKEMERAQAKIEKKRKAIEAKIEAWRAKKDGALKKDEEELSVEQVRLAKTKPVPPEGYTPAASKEQVIPPESDIWEGAFAKTACSRVAIRYAFSTCTEDRTMDKSSHERKAVYWGVPLDREGVTPYPDWSQVHQRDLSEAMLGGILKAAKEWLKTPVLSEAIEGIVPDTQFRAALDLAIRTHEGGRYSVGMHPTVYNHLLARLAGSPLEGTLVTVQSKEASYGSVYASAGDRTMKPSAHIRAYAVRIANKYPDIAFDLTELSTKVAQDEEKEQAPEQEGQQKQAKDAEDKEEAKVGQDKPKQGQGQDKGQDKPKQGQGQEQDKPPAQQQKKEAKDAEDKDAQDGAPEEQQKKEAYVALRSACIRTAAANPAAKAALMPVLQLIKKLG